MDNRGDRRGKSSRNQNRNYKITNQEEGKQGYGDQRHRPASQSTHHQSRFNKLVKIDEKIHENCSVCQMAPVEMKRQDVLESITGVYETSQELKEISFDSLKNDPHERKEQLERMSEAMEENKNVVEDNLKGFEGKIKKEMEELKNILPKENKKWKEGIEDSIKRSHEEIEAHNKEKENLLSKNLLSQRFN